VRPAAKRTSLSSIFLYQNVDFIHALEGACSLAGTGASGIAGGNFQIFENFLNRSGANVYLNTPVSRDNGHLTIKPTPFRFRASFLLEIPSIGPSKVAEEAQTIRRSL